MVVDTSAIVATIAKEQDSSSYQAALLGAGTVLMSSVAVLEARIVLFRRFGPGAVTEFEDFLYQAGGSRPLVS
jgi:uncharacterized protein with PIN domain